jgi:hypothetical protein
MTEMTDICALVNLLDERIAKAKTEEEKEAREEEARKILSEIDVSEIQHTCEGMFPDVGWNDITGQQYLNAFHEVSVWRAHRGW